MACRGDYVIRLDGTTCLQLWNTTGQLTHLAGAPLQVAAWLQACHDAGIAVRVQVNEGTTPEEGTLDVTTPADRTDTWYRQMDAALQSQGLTGLTGDIRLGTVLNKPPRFVHWIGHLKGDDTEIKDQAGLVRNDYVRAVGQKNFSRIVMLQKVTPNYRAFSDSDES